MPRPNYIIDNNFYNIGNFGGGYCYGGGGDFMATFCSTIITSSNEEGVTEASKIKVEDKNNYFNGEDVESVLSEIGEKLQKSVFSIEFTDEDHLVYTLSDGSKVDAGIVPSANLNIGNIDGGSATDN